ncbi:DUF21 domain-containing protein At4g14240 isoform X1 [Beta vulgaris subsp. vulgaris]|uniref:DUF21 domain-containing protein At4g14240 isoform X1 n=1 Tax=Beta vulgaris subsp. vulgaris TaxID=3555 RepID=UPI00053FD7CC|nr:DUF21 domain-containing protein At4g14240 isoform X1 [Beta vulgaris subsp. vulgaris]
MHMLNAISLTRMAARSLDTVSEAGHLPLGSLWWIIYAGISFVLVLFAGIMSGLTLGLMSLSRVDLEILQRSGNPSEKNQAAAILPVVQKQHQLLVTLLLCNACAMEALPLYLDKLVNQFLAIVLSVTFVLFFGEVIPQAICTRYGLAVGANFVWLVRILMIICYPISYPIGKVLDCLLGHNEVLFRRAQLKALVSIHSKEAGKGGELTHDETTIISGALDLTEKTAEAAMTPIESTFSLDVHSKLDWEAMGKILARGHSRVPVYSGTPKNIIGLLLVKSLLTVRAETETPVSAVSIRRIPRVPSDMPLYDILNEFQKGSSHMAAVVRTRERSKSPSMNHATISKDYKITSRDPELTTPLLSKQEGSPKSAVIDIEKAWKAISMNGQVASHIPSDIEDGEVIGIITLEDVFEELLQEEIVDETDEYVDVHNRIRVAAAAAASSIARAPSIRRLTGYKPPGGPHKQGQTPRKSSLEKSLSQKLCDSSSENYVSQNPQMSKNEVSVSLNLQETNYSSHESRR